jgi:hypothetical protein
MRMSIKKWMSFQLFTNPYINFGLASFFLIGLFLTLKDSFS